MAANEAVDALQNELGSLTCQDEQKLSPFKKLPPCVFVALAQRYLDGSQRVALAASEKYARETLVTTGELAPTVWRVTLLSQADAIRMLATVPPRAYAPLRWTSELVLLDSDTRGVAGSKIARYWKGLSLFVDNAPALTVLRMRKAWRISPLLFAAVKRRPEMRIEIAGPLTPEKLDDLADEGYDLAEEGRLMCSQLEIGTGPQASDILYYDSTWLRLWTQPALVELDLSHHAMEALPEALATYPLRTLRVLRANSMPQLRDTTVLARGPPALAMLTLNNNRDMGRLPARLACASSLVHLELAGSEVDVSQAWDFVKDMGKLRLLHIYNVVYDRMVFTNSVVTAHPCFVPSVLKYCYGGLSRNLISVILDALPTMSPRQLRALEPSVATLERHVQQAQDSELAHVNGKNMSTELRGPIEDLAVELRAAVGGDAPEESASATSEDGSPGWAAMDLPMGGLRGVEGPDFPLMSFAAPAYAPPRDHERAWGENVYHAITMMPAYGGKSFEELRLEDYQAAAMSGEGLRAANAAFAALAAERDRLVFRAPSPVAELRVTPDKPFVFGASAAEERVVTPETHSDKPFAFGANASGQEEPFVFGAKVDK